MTESFSAEYVHTIKVLHIKCNTFMVHTDICRYTDHHESRNEMIIWQIAVDTNEDTDIHHVIEYIFIIFIPDI